MRNLKKILALVLALVMSLSLMATAGAASFPDVDESNPYATAIDVLDQLKVFQGFEDGTFKPTDTLNRAQAAVLVYRIATGDVEGKYVDNYTYMAQSKFTDLDGYTWAKGYINYCQNAKIVVGTSATTFNPGDKVTGYQLMVMLLRTLGYGAAGEFADPKGWELETAKIAEREGILKNVTGGDFGAPAPRQMVAEILFQGLLTETVTYSALTSGGYTKTGETLGKKNLGLEKIEGIVVANEYANLDAGKTLGAGKTLLRTETKDYTLNVTSGLDEIGEYRYTYVVPAAGSRNSDLTCTGLFGDEANKTWEDTDGKKVTDSGIDTDSKTEKFVNFNDVESTPVKTVIRVGYVADITGNKSYATDADREKLLDANGGFFFKDVDGDGKYSSGDIRLWREDKVTKADKVLDDEANDITDYTPTNYPYYAKTINKGAIVSSTDQSFIDAIFLKASKLDKTDDPTLVVDGEVYVGTQNITDYSDDHTQAEFEEKCYDKVTNKVDVKENNKGNWLKVIDNNNDGVAEYVFKVVYTMAQIAKVKDSTVTLDVKNEDLVEKDIPNGINWTKIGTDDSTLNAVTSQSVNCNYDDPAAGDVVYYAVIDNKVQAYKAEVVSAVKIDKVNRNTLTATVGDTDYVQSEVHEHIMDTAYSEGVRNLVVSKVTYDLFLDRGGYLAAFVKSELGGNLVLLTDGWFMAQRGGDEYAAKVYNRETKEQDDTTITSGGELFILSSGDNNQWKQLKYFGDTIDGTLIGDLNADKVGNVVTTMVGALDEDGNLLPVDDESVYTRTTKRMIAVDDDEIVKDKYLKGVDYTTSVKAETAYDDEGNACEIRALTDTVYYYVFPAGKNVVVREYVGYNNLPSLTKADLTKIEDVYAVGTLQDRESGYHDWEYYTADVVVVEFSEWKAAAEAVFVYDFPVVTEQTKSTLDEIQIIDSTGEAKTVTVDIAESYGYTEIKQNHSFVPGLYWLYETAEEGVYKIEPLKHSEINDTEFVVGQVATTDGTAAKAYTEIGLCAWDGADDHANGNVAWLGWNNWDSSDDHAVRYLTDDSKYYTLAYDWTSDSRDWKANLDESDWETTLDESVDELAKKDIDEHTYNWTDLDGKVWYRDNHNAGATKWWNSNDVLMLTKSNGDIIWAVSLERLATDDDGDEIISGARDIWERCLPKYEAPETVALTVNAADNNTYDVKWNGGSATIDKATPVDLPVGDAENFVFTIAPQGGNSIGDVSLGDNATWLMVAKDVSEGGDGTLWRCELYRRNSKPVTQGIDAQVDVAVEVAVTVTSQAIVQAALDAYNDENATAEEKAAALAELRKYTNNAEAVETVGKADGAAADAEKLAAAKKTMDDAKAAAEAEGAGVAEEKAMYAAATAFAKAGGSAEDTTYVAIKAAATAKVTAVNDAAGTTNTVSAWKDGAAALAALTDEAVTLAGLNAEATTTLDASKATLTKVTTALNAAKDLVAKAAVISEDGSAIKAGATDAQKADYTTAYTALENAAKAINSGYTMSAVAGWTGSDNTKGEDGTLGGTLDLDDVINLNAKVNPKDAKVKVEVATLKKNDATLESVAGEENEYILTLIGADAAATDCDKGSELKTFVTVTAVAESCTVPTAWIEDDTDPTEGVFTSKEIEAADKDNGGKSVTIKITVKVMPAADKLAADKALAESKITRLEVSSNGQTTATQEALVDAVATAVGTLKYSVIAADSVKVELPEGTKFVVGNNYVDATVTLKLVLGEDADAALTAENSVTVTVENVPVEVYVSSAAN